MPKGIFVSFFGTAIIGFLVPACFLVFQLIKECKQEDNGYENGQGEREPNHHLLLTKADSDSFKEKCCLCCKNIPFCICTDGV